VRNISFSCIKISANYSEDDNNCSSIISYNYYAPNEIRISAVSEEEINRGLMSFTGRCEMLLRIVLCFYLFPPCDAIDSELIPFCITRCPELNNALVICFQRLNFLGAAQNFRTLAEAFSDFNCSDPESYYGARELNISNTKCSK